MRMLAPSLVAGLVAMAITPSAHADIERLQLQASAAGLCQSALPTGDVNLRKRPLGVYNEGDAAAYVTCSFTTLIDQDGGGGINQGSVVRYFGMFLSSSVEEPQPVRCSGVVGYEGITEYIAKEVDVSSATPDANYLYFYPDDINEGATAMHQLVSLSCRLPPGVGMNDMYVGIRLDDATS